MTPVVPGAEAVTSRQRMNEEVAAQSKYAIYARLGVGEIAEYICSAITITYIEHNGD